MSKMNEFGPYRDWGETPEEYAAYMDAVETIAKARRDINQVGAVAVLGAYTHEAPRELPPLG